MHAQRRSILRPASLILCLLASTTFLAFLSKLGFNTLWYKPKGDLWARVAPGAPRRSESACPYPYCPINNEWNKSQFAHPFNNAEDECPFYFNYIHEDLAPWATHPETDDKKKSSTGISKGMLDQARAMARFRVVIKSGRLYVDVYQKCIQTRAIFTIWGLLQLLKFYPGLVPDVEFFFECGDFPRVPKAKYKHKPPPPLFRYCGSEEHFDISFPDWSFWGWPETNLKPWDNELSGILKGGNDLPWQQRRPTAFWKGNMDMGQLRKDLKSCDGGYYGAEISHQNWYADASVRYKDSRLADQCKTRYKIYVEGQAWSVSLKYILACDSPVLLVNPVFHDFFSRGLMPMKHFWPIRVSNLCNSIKFGVEWGNNKTLELRFSQGEGKMRELLSLKEKHPRAFVMVAGGREKGNIDVSLMLNDVQAQMLGKSGQQFMTKEVSMKHVYDYMLHALREYAKLLLVKPSATLGMREVCAEEMMCRAPAEEKHLYEESMVRRESEKPPCFLHPPDKKRMEVRQRKSVLMTKLVQQAEDEGDWNAAHILN